MTTRIRSLTKGTIEGSALGEPRGVKEEMENPVGKAKAPAMTPHLRYNHTHPLGPVGNHPGRNSVSSFMPHFILL